MGTARCFLPAAHPRGQGEWCPVWGCKGCVLLASLCTGERWILLPYFLIFYILWALLFYLRLLVALGARGT